ncbi:MAG: hypothetical protein OXL41_10285 [Nitrospinae bacterium]|nr:hypothetical protein [Nitrospinota bacterium]
MNHGQLFRDACDNASIDQIAEVLNNPERAGILDSADRAMLAYAEKMTHTPHEMKKTDIESLRRVGFSEENIVDIIAAAAYRNFANSINYAYGHVEQNPEGPKELQTAIERLKKKIRGE